MLVGLDFDNTVVCYDRLFHRLAAERGLVPAGPALTKRGVRDFLRAAGREDDWTELQGIAYGPRITDAEPFPGVREFLAACREAGAEVAIVSHKTRHPYRGARHDLHAAAHAFLHAHGLYRTPDTGLSPDRVFLEPTLPAKLSRVASIGCSVFIDDLPELLDDPAFPARVRRVLFDPADAHADHDRYARVASWDECGGLILAKGRVCA